MRYSRVGSESTARPITSVLTRFSPNTCTTRNCQLSGQRAMQCAHVDVQHVKVAQNVDFQRLIPGRCNSCR
jgi:hypothetical protein